MAVASSEAIVSDAEDLQPAVEGGRDADHVVGVAGDDEVVAGKGGANHHGGVDHVRGLRLTAGVAGGPATDLVEILDAAPLQ